MGNVVGLVIEALARSNKYSIGQVFQVSAVRLNAKFFALNFALSARLNFEIRCGLVENAEKEGEVRVGKKVLLGFLVEAIARVTDDIMVNCFLVFALLLLDIVITFGIFALNNALIERFLFSLR